jgi:hypothetical protein
MQQRALEQAMVLLYLSLFAASSAGTLADDLMDRRIGTALLSAVAYLAGFLAVLQWAMPGISCEVAGLAAACVLSCVWDVWSSIRCAFSAWSRDAGADTEVLGVALLLGARMPAYVSALLALKWIS